MFTRSSKMLKNWETCHESYFPAEKGYLVEKWLRWIYFPLTSSQKDSANGYQPFILV